DRRGILFLETLLQDFRYALRSLVKNRGLSFVAIFALALGIGATTVMFSAVYNVFFDPLPYKNFSRYVVFRIQNLANVGGWKGRDFFFARGSPRLPGTKSCVRRCSRSQRLPPPVRQWQIHSPLAERGGGNDQHV